MYDSIPGRCAELVKKEQKRYSHQVDFVLAVEHRVKSKKTKSKYPLKRAIKLKTNET